MSIIEVVLIQFSIGVFLYVFIKIDLKKISSRIDKNSADIIECQRSHNKIDKMLSSDK